MTEHIPSDDNPADGDSSRPTASDLSESVDDEPTTGYRLRQEDLESEEVADFAREILVEAKMAYEIFARRRADSDEDLPAVSSDISERPSESETGTSPSITADRRLYLTDANWTAKIKLNWDREYCFAKNPGEEHFHLLMNGEIYLTRETEIFCLNCARRRGLLTDNRLHWQQGRDADA